MKMICREARSEKGEFFFFFLPLPRTVCPIIGLVRRITQKTSERITKNLDSDVVQNQNPDKGTDPGIFSHFHFPHIY